MGHSFISSKGNHLRLADRELGLISAVLLQALEDPQNAFPNEWLHLNRAKSYIQENALYEGYTTGLNIDSLCANQPERKTILELVTRVIRNIEMFTPDELNSYLASLPGTQTLPGEKWSSDQALKPLKEFKQFLGHQEQA